METANLVVEHLNCQFISTGGIYRQQTLSFIGDFAVNTIQQHYVQKFFFSGAAVNTIQGVTDFTSELVSVKRAFIQNAQKVFLLVDETKVNGLAFSHVCPLERVDVMITTSEADVSGEVWAPWRERIYFA